MPGRLMGMEGGLPLLSRGSKACTLTCFARVGILTNVPPVVVCPLATLTQWHQETTLTESWCEDSTADAWLDRDLTHSRP